MRSFVVSVLIGGAGFAAVVGMAYLGHRLGQREADRKEAELRQHFADSDAEAAVLNHPFWTRKPSRAELDATLARLTHPAAPEVLAVDSEGVLSEVTCDRSFCVPTQYPEGHAREWVLVMAWQDRAAALVSLRKALDRKVQRQDYRKKYASPSD